MRPALSFKKYASSRALFRCRFRRSPNRDEHRIPERSDGYGRDSVHRGPIAANWVFEIWQGNRKKKAKIAMICERSYDLTRWGKISDVQR